MSEDWEYGWAAESSVNPFKCHIVVAGDLLTGQVCPVIHNVYKKQDTGVVERRKHGRTEESKH